jgi:putative phosphotransacetylase
MPASISPDTSSLTLEQMTREVVRRLVQQTNGHGAAPVAAAPLQRREGVLELQVPIGVSVRHVHLCPQHLQILFGEGYDLHIFNELYQKGYYAAKEQVMVVGRKRCIEKVRVLGPTRPYSQVELAQSDALVIGLKLPVATEGADPGTQPVTIVGPEGAISLPGSAGGGAFVARRHIHLSDVTDADLGVKHGDLLELRIDGMRPTTLHGVLVRVKAGWRTEVHLDTDEANACGVRNGQTGTLIIRR